MLFRASDLQLFAILTNTELPILTEYSEFWWKTAAILNFGNHFRIFAISVWLHICTLLCRVNDSQRFAILTNIQLTQNTVYFNEKRRPFWISAWGHLKTIFQNSEKILVLYIHIEHLFYHMPFEITNFDFFWFILLDIQAIFAIKNIQNLIKINISSSRCRTGDIDPQWWRMDCCI